LPPLRLKRGNERALREAGFVPAFLVGQQAFDAVGFPSSILAMPSLFH
jgi:hypothetical protein